jgi:uncharacterized MnhB-related membrane protein
MGVIVDAIYQVIALRWFYLVESPDVAITVAIVPYLLIRGPVGHLVLWWQSRSQR